MSHQCYVVLLLALLQEVFHDVEIIVEEESTVGSLGEVVVEQMLFAPIVAHSIGRRGKDQRLFALFQLRHSLQGLLRPTRRK